MKMRDTAGEIREATNLLSPSFMISGGQRFQPGERPFEAQT